MNIRQEILKEHSKAQTDKIVKYVGNNPARFKALIDVFVEGPYRVTQRSAWPLSHCAEQNPALVKPHLGILLKFLVKSGTHNAVKRNILRFLQFISIPKKFQGTVATACFGFLQSSKEPIAVRVFAMSVLASVARENPEMKPEIITIIEDLFPYSSAGFQSRGRKVLKELKAPAKARLL